MKTGRWKGRCRDGASGRGGECAGGARRGIKAAARMPRPIRDQTNNCAILRPPMQIAPFSARCGDKALQRIAPVRQRAVPPRG